MANFILEFTDQDMENPLAIIELQSIQIKGEEGSSNSAPWWILHVDGAVNNEGAGADIVLISPEGHHLPSAIHFNFKATNNDAEYEALISGLKLSLKMRIENLVLQSDSMLVVH